MPLGLRPSYSPQHFGLETIPLLFYPKSTPIQKMVQEHFRWEQSIQHLSLQKPGILLKPCLLSFQVASFSFAASPAECLIFITDAALTFVIFEHEPGKVPFSRRRCSTCVHRSKNVSLGSTWRGSLVSGSVGMLNLVGQASITVHSCQAR